MRFNLTTIACPAVAILLATWTSSCLKGPGFLKQGETEALTSLIQTTEEAGDVTGSYSAASNRYQTILASSSSAVSGASVIFPPGSLSFSTSIILGEGSDAASADVLAQLGLDSSAVSGVGSSLYVSASDATDLIVPMSLSLPLFSSSSLFLDADTSRYAVAYVGIKLETKETSVGLIPNKEITFKDGNATFETSTWGSYRLVQISEEVEKPVERMVKPTAEAPPKRNNEVKDLPKMLVTGRKPFVVQPVGKFTVTGENLIGMRAFIKDRKLTLKESSDGKSVEIQLPTTEELIATTSSATTRGRGRGMFVIGLGQDGSPGTDTNIMILDTAATASAFAFSLNSEAVCARQNFIAGDGTTRTGTGTRNCTGRPAAETACTAGKLSKCFTTAAWPAVEVARVRPESLKSGTVLTLATGTVTGAFPSSTSKLTVPTNTNAADISAHPDFANLPAFGASPTDTRAITLLTDEGEGVTFNLRSAGAQTSTAANAPPPLLTPGLLPIERSGTKTLYTGFEIAGTGLRADMIVADKSIFGVKGTTPPRNYWSKSGTTWIDGATGYNWYLVNNNGTPEPATCTQGSLPSPQDLFWAWSTGMTSGPGAMLTQFTSPNGTTPTSIKLWTQTTINGTANYKIFEFPNAGATSQARSAINAESAWTACVYKPVGSAGNGP